LFRLIGISLGELIQCTAYIENKYPGNVIFIIIIGDNNKNYITRIFVFLQKPPQEKSPRGSNEIASKQLPLAIIRYLLKIIASKQLYLAIIRYWLKIIASSCLAKKLNECQPASCTRFFLSHLTHSRDMRAFYRTFLMVVSLWCKRKDHTKLSLLEL
jgi:hypothetical protein